MTQLLCFSLAARDVEVDDSAVGIAADSARSVVAVELLFRVSRRNRRKYPNQARERFRSIHIFS